MALFVAVSTLISALVPGASFKSEGEDIVRSEPTPTMTTTTTTSQCYRAYASSFASGGPWSCPQGMAITSSTECEQAVRALNTERGSSGYGSLTTSSGSSYYASGCSANCFSDFSGYFCAAWNSGSGSTQTYTNRNIFCKAAYCESEAYPTQVNFQPSALTVPRGWVADYGKRFGPRQDGFHYGWLCGSQSRQNTLLAIGPDAMTRRRRAALAPQSCMLSQVGGESDMNNSYIEVQGVVSGMCTREAWEVTVPSGAYLVEISVYGGPASVTIEGTPIMMQGHVNQDIVVSQTVSVSDGRLTLDFPNTTLPVRISHIKLLQSSTEVLQLCETFCPSAFNSQGGLLCTPSLLQDGCDGWCGCGIAKCHKCDCSALGGMCVMTTTTTTSTTTTPQGYGIWFTWAQNPKACPLGHEIQNFSQCVEAISYINTALSLPGYGGVRNAAYSFYPPGCSVQCYLSFTGHFCGLWNSASPGSPSYTSSNPSHHAICKGTPPAGSFLLELYGGKNLHSHADGTAVIDQILQAERELDEAAASDVATAAGR